MESVTEVSSSVEKERKKGAITDDRRAGLDGAIPQPQLKAGEGTDTLAPRRSPNGCLPRDGPQSEVRKVRGYTRCSIASRSTSLSPRFQMGVDQEELNNLHR